MYVLYVWLLHGCINANKHLEAYGYFRFDQCDVRLMFSVILMQS